MNTIDGRSGRQRRTHSPEFKAQLVAQCREPGVSLAAIAVANGLNPILLRRWVNERGGLQREPEVRVRWPADRADACAAWLRGWLR